MNLVWIVGSALAGLSVFGLNGMGVRLRAAAPWLGYGIVAAYFGLAVEGGLNGALMRHFGRAPGVVGYALVGIGAAFSQTFGKWLVLRFVERLGGLRSSSRVMVVGLAVGLGFGLAEVVILGEGRIARHVGIVGFPWAAIWENAAAVGLHMFSGAILAIGIYERRWLPLAVVLAVCAVDETMAGVFSGGGIAMPVAGVFLTLLTAGLWLYCRRLWRKPAYIPGHLR